MFVKTGISCSVCLAVHKKVTAIQVFAEQVNTWLWFKKRYFCPVMRIHLDPERRQKVSDKVHEYPACRVSVDMEKMRELGSDCFTRMKVKWGKKTIRKKAVNLKPLIECLQNESQCLAKIHVALEVSSFYPLTFTLKTETEETQTQEDNLPTTEVEEESEDKDF